MPEPATPLISIIIPVYNVYPYLSRCMESVLAQTHSNLEIFLIDDGSTDGSGELCDDFAGKDARIRVIHQANAGVSAARNAGLDAAQGEWVGFVDSDDWIEPDMYEKLLGAAVDSGMEVAACRLAIHNFNGELTKATDSLEIVGEVSRMEALDYIVRDRYFATMYNLIYNRNTLEANCSLRLNTNFHISEDRSFNAEVFLRVSGLVLVPDQLYHYCMRNSSSVNSFSEKRLTSLAAREHIATLVSPISSALLKQAQYRCMENAVYLINRAVRNKEYKYLPMLKKSARRYAITYFLSSELNLAQKLRNMSVMFFPKFTNMVWEILQKRFNMKRLIKRMNSK